MEDAEEVDIVGNSFLKSNRTAGTSKFTDGTLSVQSLKCFSNQNKFIFQHNVSPLKFYGK
jgi:hypothetical protein